MSVLTRFITTTDFWYYNYIFSSLVWHTGVRKLMSLATFHAHTRLIAESHVIWGSQGVTHREEDCLCWWWDLTPYCKIRLPHRWLQDPAEVNWHVQEVHSTENTTPDTGERTSRVVLLRLSLRFTAADIPLSYTTALFWLQWSIVCYAVVQIKLFHIIPFLPT